MQHRIFFDHYRICENPGGSPQELGRSGAAIIYKATDARSSQPVALQLIPLASIEPATREQFEQRARLAQQLDHVNIARVLEVGTESDFLVLVSEFVEGETTEAWVVANGPMPAEAALRIGLEVVRALEAAAFFSLTHRALQPSNIMIVPGTAPDGAWPFVKLLNFGLASTESHASETPGAMLAPASVPQFASPEQLRNEPLDFRSEVYSLAATMCFLVTGAAPLPNTTDGRLRRFPELRRLPRSLRNLLSAMLSQKPEHRPQDPVALENEMRNCLTALEQRQLLRRKFGIPTIAALSRTSARARPVAQVLRGAIAFALLLLIAAGVTAAFFPRLLHFNRSAEDIGVPIGVPEPQSSGALAQNSAPRGASPSTIAPTAAPSNESAAAASAEIVASNQTAAASPTRPTSPEQVGAGDSQSEAAPPAEGPEENASSNPASKNETVASNDSSPNERSIESSAEEPSKSERAGNSRLHAKTRPAASAESSHRPRFAETTSDESHRLRQTYSRSGSFRAQWIGETPDGRPILRLRSGRVVIATPGAPIEESVAPRRRVIIRQQESDDAPAPWQPFIYQPRD